MVEKRRRLLLWEGVRIHLDEVEGLGSFLELEATDADPTKVDRLRAELDIPDERLIAGSYSDLLLDSRERLLAAARAAMENAYAPHSGFKVGAALRTPTGAVYSGANVENAAYPQSQCAEASAIGALVAAGEREIAAVAVVAEQMDVCPPCGGCRQRLSEFASADTPVYLGASYTTTLGELLPLSFTPRFVSWREAAEVIVQRAGLAPRVGLVLGSGLGEVADAVEDATVIPYSDLPGFPVPGVEGHAGRAVAGQIGGVPVVAFQGRAHLYEGIDLDEIRVPVRALKAAGAEILVLTNAAGSLRIDIGPGGLMLIEDHINMTGVNVLAGPNADELGPRFPSLRDAYDPQLRSDMRVAARDLGIELHQGVYLAVRGPSFETPAEIRAFHTLGADAVGMSTVHETTVARHCGLRVVAVSAITNYAEGMSDEPVSHEQTLRDAARAAADLAPLITRFVSGAA